MMTVAKLSLSLPMAMANVVQDCMKKCEDQIRENENSFLLWMMSVASPYSVILFNFRGSSSEIGR